LDIHGLPFKRLPKLMITELIRRAVMLLNVFPALDGVSKTLSPRSIMTGKPNLDYNNCKIEFGSYALVFEDNDPTNTTKLHSTRAIALNPTGNTEGDYHFMSLTTGHRLARRQWTAVSMPDAMIAAVESRVEAKKQPMIEGGCPCFEWQPNIALWQDDTEPQQDKTRPSALALLADAAEDVDPAVPGLGLATDGTLPIENFGAQHPDHDTADHRCREDGVNVHDDMLSLNDADDEAVMDDIAVVEQHPDPLPAVAEMQDPGNQVSDNKSAADDITVETVDPAEAVFLEDSQSTVNVPWDEESQAIIDNSKELPDEQSKTNDNVIGIEDTSDVADAVEPQPAGSQHYNLRPTRDRLYSHRLASNMNAATGTKLYDLHVQLLQFASNNMETCPGDMFLYIFGFMMTQMTASQGIRKHGQKAMDALFSEFCQLDDRTSL